MKSGNGVAFFNATYNDVPILDVKHAALESNTAIRTGQAWRDAEAARSILGMDYDTFADTVPRDRKITVLAQYEIKWRLEAIQNWEHTEEMKAKDRAKPKPRAKRSRR